MKSFKTIRKTASIVMGVLGVTSIMSSCNKEKECECTMSETYNDGSSTYTESYEIDVTTNEKCVELNREYTVNEDGYTYTYKIECEKK